VRDCLQKPVDDVNFPLRAEKLTQYFNCSSFGGESRSMSALQSKVHTSRQARPRVHIVPRCSTCADTLVAPEASVFKPDGEVSYLWSCDTCGQGLVTDWR
jgi:transcription elongation factor Elf1